MDDQGRAAAPDEDEREFLRRQERPDYEAGPDPLRVVDLFCGCGAMTLGVAEAAHRAGRGTEVPLAVDADHTAAEVYKHNFAKADVREAAVESLIDGELGEERTGNEEELHDLVGAVDVLVGGPPCQGHSDLNNHTRRDDSRNALYARMARAAEILQPRALIVENVPGALRDRQRVVDVTEKALVAAGYGVAHRVLRLVDMGVPQSRRRHLLLALADGSDAEAILDSLKPAESPTEPRTVRWAIEDLEDLSDVSDVASDFDRPSQITHVNRERIDWLFDHDAYDLPNEHRPECHQDGEHSYGSMYGRLRWDEPAQTITTGFGSMGQGRFVHPSCRRTLTPHEAARLQFLPDFLDLTVVSKRTAWARMIGNAVPALVTLRLMESLLTSQPWTQEPS